MKHVALIGSEGYIGSAVKMKLLNTGAKVTGIDLDLYGSNGDEKVKVTEGYSLKRCDYRNYSVMRKIFENCDEVILMGGLVGDPACAFDTDTTIDLNYSSTVVLANIAKSVGVKKFIFMSSCSVYGQQSGIASEDAVPNPVSLYAETKLNSERQLIGLNDENFMLRILRFSTIYGVSTRFRLDLVANLLTYKAISTGEVTVFNGSQWRPMLHVEDAAKAVVLASENETFFAQPIFNVGSDGENYQIKQIGKMVSEAVPGSEIIESQVAEDPRSYSVSFDKIKELLNFSPDWDLRKGILQVKSYILENEDMIKQMSTSNIDFLKERGTVDFDALTPRFSYR
jgi:nucleoside-diphosphate-sugar epimerase